MNQPTALQLAKAGAVQGMLQAIADGVSVACVYSFDFAACNNVATEIRRWASGGLERAIRSRDAAKLATALETSARIIDAARAHAGEVLMERIDNAQETATGTARDVRKAAKRGSELLPWLIGGAFLLYLASLLSRK